MSEREPGDSTYGTGKNPAAAVAESVDIDVRGYLSGVLATMVPRRSAHGASQLTERSVAEEVFRLLTSRRFCYLGRKKVESYRSGVVSLLLRRISTGERLRFFYDIGPGYHATTRPSVLPLRYDVGLSELLILGQIAAFCRRLDEFYPPGARFWLVVDNLCALRTNDVPLELTTGYVRQLRQLIDETQISDTVELLVESETFELDKYDQLLAGIKSRSQTDPPSPEAVENVARFLGRHCSSDEALERIEKYRRASLVTDRLFNRFVQDVHMTQRATGATLGFRAFPGGDQRTQSGELALIREPKGRLRPVLLTTRNIDHYDCVFLELLDLLPKPITRVTFASKSKDGSAF